MRLRPAFVALDDVVYFPVTLGRLTPAAILKRDWITAEMAVSSAFSTVADLMC